MNLQRRPRRNRKSDSIREMVAEVSLRPSQFVYPIFVQEGKQNKTEIKSMPNFFRLTPDLVLKDLEEILKLNLKNIILFPQIEEKLKDKTATLSYKKNNLYLKMIRSIKQEFPEITIITDVAMDPYSSDGHDGLLENGKILNDPTLEILGKMALAQAESGADILGPSDMMDGRVGYIRDILDKNSFTDVGIMSYTVKYASSFYGPFRDALESAPKTGDKKTYQMDWRNAREALLEAELDFNEGADYLMVKPALCYLDIIQKLKENFSIPIVAYNVSGEYAMIKAAGKLGWLDEKKAMIESLTAIRRAGADIVISYFAKDFASIYQSGNILL